MHKHTNDKVYASTRSDTHCVQFYNSGLWQSAREYKRTRSPVCEVCSYDGVAVRADVVHHVEEVKESWDKRLDFDNLISLCQSCHNAVHAGNFVRKSKIKAIKANMHAQWG